MVVSFAVATRRQAPLVDVDQTGRLADVQINPSPADGPADKPSDIGDGYPMAFRNLILLASTKDKKALAGNG
jgi:hypothetical protein